MAAVVVAAVAALAVPAGADGSGPPAQTDVQSGAVNVTMSAAGKVTVMGDNLRNVVRLCTTGPDSIEVWVWPQGPSDLGAPDIVVTPFTGVGAVRVSMMGGNDTVYATSCGEPAHPFPGWVTINGGAGDDYTTGIADVTGHLRLDGGPGDNDQRWTGDIERLQIRSGDGHDVVAYRGTAERGGGIGVRNGGSHIEVEASVTAPGQGMSISSNRKGTNIVAIKSGNLARRLSVSTAGGADDVVTISDVEVDFMSVASSGTLLVEEMDSTATKLRTRGQTTVTLDGWVLTKPEHKVPGRPSGTLTVGAIGHPNPNAVAPGWGTIIETIAP
ncbi:MAG: hypothetical protein ACR2QK_07885 [Acidimicrobiales bacterium]